MVDVTVNAFLGALHSFRVIYFIFQIFKENHPSAIVYMGPSTLTIGMKKIAK